MVNNAGNVLMDSFVRQKERVTDYRTRFSGVRPADLREDRAEPFEEVQRAAAALFEGRVLVGHAVENDLQVPFQDSVGLPVGMAKWWEGG